MLVSSRLWMFRCCRFGAKASVEAERSRISELDKSNCVSSRFSGSTERSLTRVELILRRISGLSAIGVRSDRRWLATSRSDSCMRPCRGDRSAINPRPFCSCNLSRSSKCAKGNKSPKLGSVRSRIEIREKVSRPFNVAMFWCRHSNWVSSPAVTWSCVWFVRQLRRLWSSICESASARGRYCLAASLG